jgi:flagellar motor component MotA
MDYLRAIRELQEEKRRLDKAIETLEALIAGQSPIRTSRRGRKSMPPEERKQVSERMKRYWEARRAAAKNSSES